MTEHVIPMLEEEEENIDSTENQEDLIELRSEEVQEILGTPPSWMVRWGTTLAALVLAILVFVAWLIKYPEIKYARLVLTTSIPPSPLVARVDANIEKIYVTEEEFVTNGQILSVLQSTSRFDDVLMLEGDLEELKTLDETEIIEYQPDRTLKLGSLQDDYSNLVEKFETYNRGETTDYVQQSVSRLQQEKNSILANINVEKLKLIDIQLELDNAEIDQDRVQQLFVSQVSSKLDLEKAQNKVLNVRERIKQVRSSILTKEQELTSKNRAIENLQNKKEEKSDDDFVKLREEIHRLESQIDNWKQNYLIISPVDGQVAFDGVIKENQFVAKGKTLLRVIPDKNKEWIGRVELPSFGSGKVEEGQRVVIKFDNYSFEEYGVVEGLVRSKSILPSGDTYYLEVEFPNGLRTSYKKDIPYKPEMQGSAEIITDNKRFLTWVFDRLISRFNTY